MNTPRAGHLSGTIIPGSGWAYLIIRNSPGSGTDATRSAAMASTTVRNRPMPESYGNLGGSWGVLGGNWGFTWSAVSKRRLHAGRAHRPFLPMLGSAPEEISRIIRELH